MFAPVPSQESLAFVSLVLFLIVVSCVSLGFSMVFIITELVYIYIYFFFHLFIYWNMFCTQNKNKKFLGRKNQKLYDYLRSIFDISTTRAIHIAIRSTIRRNMPRFCIFCNPFFSCNDFSSPLSRKKCITV